MAHVLDSLLVIAMPIVLLKVSRWNDWQFKAFETLTFESTLDH